MIEHIAVFVAYFVLDIVWAWYTKAIAAGHALRAAMWAGVIPLIVMSTTLLAVNDPWLVLSAAGGGAIGTYVAIDGVAFVGCTAYEAQVGRLWVRIARPRFWGCMSLIEFGWEKDE